jgi:ABC-type lipoprotein export system ATPase subunit
LLHQLQLLRRPTRVETFTLREPGSSVTPHDVRRLWEDGRQRPLEALRGRLLGHALQRPELLPALTVYENVALPLHLQGIRPVRKRVESLLRALSCVGPNGEHDLLALARQRPHRLSGGQEQRVALARGLVHSPTLLFADEPTNNIDPATTERILQFLDDYRRQRSCAVVMVSHQPERVRKYADRLIRMDRLGGKKAAGGIVAEERLSRSPAAPEGDAGSEPAPTLLGAAEL